MEARHGQNFVHRITALQQSAGADNVELIWLFKTGNATVILASVRTIQLVMSSCHCEMELI